MLNPVEKQKLHARLSPIIAQIEKRSGGSLELISQPEADLLASVTAVGVIGNGGFTYWFGGADSSRTLRCAEAFDRMAMPKVAEALRNALLALPSDLREGLSQAEIAKRRAFLEANRDALKGQWTSLEKVVWQEPYYPSAIAYVRLKSGELIMAHPKLKRSIAQIVSESESSVSSTGSRRKPWWRFW